VQTTPVVGAERPRRQMAQPSEGWVAPLSQRRPDVTTTSLPRQDPLRGGFLFWSWSWARSGSGVECKVAVTVKAAAKVE
jgi:hypothetical protein